MNDNSKKDSLEKENREFQAEGDNKEKDSSFEKKASEEIENEKTTEKVDEEKIILLAEIENIKKIHLREKSDLIKYSNQKLISRIIPLLDNYETALRTSEMINDENVKKFLSGISMAIEDFKNSLKNEGVEEYSIELGKDIWDSRFCEVVDEAESDEHEEGTVLSIVRKGYLLNSRMIRPASVVISKKK